METLNIVGIIEKSPMTRLNKDYENKLLTKIQNTFSESQQQIFVGSFYAYLNYDSKKDFVIDFDSVWKWTRFSRKDPAKRVLEKNFVNGVDYKVETYAAELTGVKFEDEKGFPQLSGDNFEDVIQDEKGFPQLEGESFKDEEKTKSPEINKGGRPKEKILLTVNTFKKFCLKANTKKADEIHDYYIKLEELLQETINEESEELRLQLKIKDDENIKLKNKNNKLSKYVVTKYSKRYKPGFILYLITSTEKMNEFKVGITKNMYKRLQDLNNGSPYHFEIIELFYTEFYIIIESIIKEIFAKYRISVNCEFYDKKILDQMKIFIKEQIELFEKYKLYSCVNIFNNITDDDKIEDLHDHDILDYDKIEDLHDHDILDDDKIEDLHDEIKDTLQIYIDNVKKCINCKETHELRLFFSIDKKNKIFQDNCINCYEKEHGNSKQCSKCEKIKRKIDFVVDRTKKDGLTYDCKSCRYELNKKIKEENNKKNPNIGKIECNTCNTFQDKKEFYRLKISDGNYDYIDKCKTCYVKEHGQSKQCFTCDEIKNVSEFQKTKANTDGIACYCKSCMKIKRDKEKEDKKSKEDPNKDKKQCVKCNEFFKYNMFFHNSDESLYEECKTCYNPNSIQCNRCNEIKLSECFSKDSHKKNGYRTICKLCTNNKSES
jgi:hypothetical protein